LFSAWISSVSDLHSSPVVPRAAGARNAGSAPELIIEARPGWIAVDWRELWDSREILGFLILRDLKVRYKQTVLGVLWAALQPLATMAIFTVIFGNFAKIPSQGLPYAVFVFAGLLPWTFFSNGVGSASQSLLAQQHLLTKIYLPRLFVPATAIGSGLVDLGISLVVFVGIMLWYGMLPGWGFLALPLLVVLTTAAALGVGMALAALTITYRDFRYVVPFMVQSWMYISPVIYPVESVPGHWRWLLALNPMTGVIGGFRSATLGRPWDLTTFAISTASAVVLFVFGLYYFRKTERRFADVA
jgi:lipopolysaccharide transport system permease protein